MFLKIAAIYLIVQFYQSSSLIFPGACPDMPPTSHSSGYLRANVNTLIPMTSFDSYILKEFPGNSTCLLVTFTMNFISFDYIFHPAANKLKDDYEMRAVKSKVADIDTITYDIHMVAWENHKRMPSKCHENRSESFRIWTRGFAVAMWSCVQNATHHDEGTLVALQEMGKRSEEQNRIEYDAILSQYFNSSWLRGSMRMAPWSRPDGCPWFEKWSCGEVQKSPNFLIHSGALGFACLLLFLSLVAFIVLVKLILDK